VVTEFAYLDASAIVKLVVAEPASDHMHRWYVEARRVITSRVGIIETVRAAARATVDAPHLDRVLTDLEVVELDAATAGTAARARPPTLRTLDAIHLATALALLPDLDAFVTYDDRLAEAARAIGLPVVRPG
jgi:predicted nucleic acid-binding protein